MRALADGLTGEGAVDALAEEMFGTLDGGAGGRSVGFGSKSVGLEDIDDLVVLDDC